MSRDRDGRADRRGEPAGDGLRFLVAVLQEQGELVAAEPGDGVLRAHRAGQPVRHGDEGFVPGLVTEGAVDRLEAVEVDQRDEDLAA